MPSQLNMPTMAAFVMCAVSALLAAVVLMSEGSDFSYQALFALNFVLSGVLGTRLLKQWREPAAKK